MEFEDNYYGQPHPTRTIIQDTSGGHPEYHADCAAALSEEHAPWFKKDRFLRRCYVNDSVVIDVMVEEGARVRRLSFENIF